MQQLSISQANRLYEQSEKCRIRRHRVHEGEVLTFSGLVRELEKQSTDFGAEDYWAPSVRVLRRLRFELHAFPLAAGQIVENNAKALSRVERLLQRCEHTHPGLVDIAAAISTTLAALSQSTSNPLLERIVDESANCVLPAAILINESRGVDQVEKLVRSLDSEMDVVVASQLRSQSKHATLFVVGPSRWYPRFIFDAPRVTHVELVHHASLKDSLPEKSVFLGASVEQKGSPQKLQGRIPREEDCLLYTSPSPRD